jgi:AAA domain-containing protein
LYDLIIGSRPKSNGAWAGGAYAWSEDWVKRKLDEVCEQVRSAKKGHWDEVRRSKVLVFGRYVGGGAYDVEAAWKELEKAAKQCAAPDDYVREVKRAFFNGVKQPLDPPREARAGRALPESQWLGERPIATPPALIKGVLPQTGVAIIGGQSGTGKTFQAIHLATCLIPDCSQSFYIDHYPIKRHGGVLYIVLEGKPAFPMRVMASFEAILGTQLQLDDRAKFPFSWNTFEPNLYTDDKSSDALIKLAERDGAKMRRDFNVDLVAVFIDTMGLAACYENEDKAAQVQRVVSRLGQVSDATGALIIGVDHFGKDQGAGLRGSSAKRGHVETVLACLTDNDNGDDKPKNLRMKFEKIRDGEEGRIIPYRLKLVDWGMDEDNKPVSTCIIQWETQRPLPKKKGRGRGRPNTINVTLLRAMDEVGLPADPDALKEAFYKYHGGKPHAANAAWNRALESAGLGLFDGKLDYLP